MTGLRVILVVIGLVCLLSASLGAFVPWPSLSRGMACLGFDDLSLTPLGLYALRLASLGCGLFGVFFLILASDPIRYRPMLALATVGLFLLGFAALAIGWLLRVQPPWYLADAGFCLLGALLILIFWPRSVPQPQPSAE